MKLFKAINELMKVKIFSEVEVNKKESCINSDEICDYIAKEFNVKRFIYETGSERSIF